MNMIDNVRRRPGMYVGDSGTYGARHMLLELMGNCLDLYLCGQSKGFHLSFHEQEAQIIDDGPGFPFDVPSPTGTQSLGEDYLTTYHDTPSADQHVPHVHVVSHGVGLFPINALCSFFQIETWREGKRWRQTYRRGVPDAPPVVIEEGNGKGTCIKLKLDKEIFEDHPFELEALLKHCQHIAYLFPGIHVGLSMKKKPLKQPNLKTYASFQELRGEWFHEPDGLLAMARGLHRATSSEGLAAKELYGHKKGKEIDITFAAVGSAEQLSVPFSWVNGVHTLERGSHVSGVFSAFRGESWSPAIALVHVVMRAPSFKGPTMTRLDSRKAQFEVRQYVQELLRTRR